MYKVMVVDDMDIVRRELKRSKVWGETSGFVICQEARNGQEALEAIVKNPVDLVITDIKMPKIDGIELLRALVAKDLCSCVVLLSDFSEFGYARQGIILGAFDYMTKPVDEAELESLLQRVRDHIESEKKEKDRVRRLEEAQWEKVELLMPVMDVAKLMELIQTGDEKALESIEHIVDRLGEATNYDMMKLESVLINGIPEIITGLLKTNPWLEKFIDISGFEQFELSQYKVFDAAKNLFMDRIKAIISLFLLLHCNTQEKGLIKQVCSFVLDNIEKDLSLTVVADHLFMNKTYISEIFKQKTGTTFIEYLTLVKMERAKILIIRENLKTYEIAEMLNYKDVEYFSKVFKKSVGVSPTEFRRNYDK